MKTSSPTAGMCFSKFSSQRWYLKSKVSGEKPVVWCFPMVAEKPGEKRRNSRSSVRPYRIRNSQLYWAGKLRDLPKKEAGELSMYTRPFGRGDALVGKLAVSGPGLVTS